MLQTSEASERGVPDLGLAVFAVFAVALLVETDDVGNARRLRRDARRRPFGAWRLVWSERLAEPAPGK